MLLPMKARASDPLFSQRQTEPLAVGGSQR